MEGLAYDFGGEKEDKDKDAEDGPEKPTRAEARDKRDDESAEKTKPTLSELLKNTIEKIGEELPEEPTDLNPELEAEASVEHLNEPEVAAIAQTIATDRLEEIYAEGPEIPKSEDLAAESFLENVQASGDIDQSFHETMEELGEASMEISAPVEIHTETAPPVDPESLIEVARKEITPHVSYELPKHEIKNQAEESLTSRHTSVPSERPKKTGKTESKPVVGSIVDYVIGRRYGRLNPEASHKNVERTLGEEVEDVRLQLAARETHVRQIAQNKAFERKPADIALREQTKQETISTNAIMSDQAKYGRVKGEEKQTAIKREAAGISAHTMNHSELLGLASEIEVEDSNLRSIFEGHLIGERGLRRVVAEYLRGGDFMKALKRELLEKEKDFERDPKLRDQGLTMPVAVQSTQLDNLLHKSGIDWNEPMPTILPVKSAKRPIMPAIISDLKGGSGLLKRIANIILIVLIIIFAGAIIYLLMKR